MDWGWIGAALDVAFVIGILFLAAHLFTDARRMVLILGRAHSRKGHKDSTDFGCPRCKDMTAGVKEAWWEVFTLVALVGHLVMDFVGG